MDIECNSGSDGGFFSLSACELTLLSFGVAVVLADNLDEKQRALLGNFLVTVGVNLGNLTPGAWAV